MDTITLNLEMQWHGGNDRRKTFILILVTLLPIKRTVSTLLDSVSHTSYGELCIPAPTDPLHRCMRFFGQLEHRVLPTLNKLELVRQTDRWIAFIFSPNRTLIVIADDSDDATEDTSDDVVEHENIIAEDDMWDQVIYTKCLTDKNTNTSRNEHCQFGKNNETFRHEALEDLHTSTTEIVVTGTAVNDCFVATVIAALELGYPTTGVCEDILHHGDLLDKVRQAGGNITTWTEWKNKLHDWERAKKVAKFFIDRTGLEDRNNLSIFLVILFIVVLYTGLLSMIKKE